MAVNVELLQKTLQTIKDNPNHWHQLHWHCGTTHCFAGFAELLVKNLPVTEAVDSETFLAEETQLFATKHLGITEDDSDILFRHDNCLATLEMFVEELCEYGTIQSIPLD